uniref:Reverse transcriptase domain-containing protein n=1 Tax=Amphiprion percula TaxID=161767 RepID=A0A3P8RSJ0_AMPPE
MFADDVLVFLEEPEESFTVLMTLLNNFGQLSGYKLNITKTQVMTLNYSASESLRDKYDLEWEASSLKYLAIILTKDTSKLYQANYDPGLHKNCRTKQERIQKNIRERRRRRVDKTGQVKKR